MRFCRDRRLDDPGPFDPARGDDLRFPDPGGADLVLVEAGPVPLGHVTRSGGTSVPPGNDQAALVGPFGPGQGGQLGRHGRAEQHHGGAGGQEALAFGL
jgi:hypothetical protein